VGYHEGQETGERVGAIVVPNLDAIQASCGHTELEWATVESMIRQVVQQQCLQLSDYKRPRKVDVRREPLDRTSIQKVRRHLYQGALDTPS